MLDDRQAQTGALFRPAVLDIHAVEALGKTPLLALGMKLGEGTGAALAAGIVKAAAACHSGMATFEQAGVSNKSHD